MSIFTKHNAQTAADNASQVLSLVKQRYGFIPNLAAYIAESPIVLEAVLKLSEAFDKTSLTPKEQQVVLLTVSVLNGCLYCKTVHSALAKKVNMDETTIQDIIAIRPLKDKKLDILRNFTQSLIEEKALLSDEKLQSFLDAGFTKSQIFEVVMGIALKTLTNYSNHLAGAEPNEEFIAMSNNETAA